MAPRAAEPKPRTYAPVLLPLLLAAGLWAGCARTEGPTVTEQARLNADPRVGAFLIQAQQTYERGLYGLALALTDSAEVYAPDLADIHFLRGMIYTQLNQLDIARAAYETVLEHDPEYKGARYNAFRRGKLRDAIDLYQAEKALEPTSGLLLELGQAYAKLGEPDSARMAYEEALALDSTNATVYMWMGQLYEERGDLDQALAYSRKGLTLRPDNADYRYIIGTLLNRTGHPDEALEYLEPVARARPWHHGAQYNLGQVLMRLGREREAGRYFARADSAQQMQQQINEAQNAINRAPDSLANWVDLGTLLRRSGQYDKAIEAYKVAVSMEPWNLHLQNNLAILMMESGDTEGAIRRYRAILSIDSTMADVWFNLGVALANEGMDEAARKAWQKTLAYRPGHPAARAYLARLPEPAS